MWIVQKQWLVESWRNDNFRPASIDDFNATKKFEIKPDTHIRRKCARSFPSNHPFPPNFSILLFLLQGSSVYSPDTLTSPSEAPKSKEIDPSPDVKSLAPHTPVTSHFNHSPKKRKLSKTVCDLLESENSSKQSHIPTQKADSSDINPNSSSSCGEDSGPGEEVGRNLIKSESIEIFRVVPHEFLDDPVEVFSNTLKRKLDPAKDRIDSRKTTVVSSEFTRCSPKFLNPPFDQNSNRHDFELELMQVKEEGDLTDEVDDTLSNASESPIKGIYKIIGIICDSVMIS